MVICAIVLEGGVYMERDLWSPDLLKQLNIEDTEENRKTKFVKCWFGVSFGIFGSINQISETTLKVRQEELPSWFNESDAFERTKEAFKKWYDRHVFVDQEIDELSSGFYYLKNCKVERLLGDVNIQICEECRIDIMLDKARIEWCYNSQIGKMFDESNVYIGNENTLVKHAYGNSQIEYKDVVLLYDHRNKEES